MKNSIHISELSEEVYEFLSQDILNRVFKLQLKPYQVFGGPDLWQKNPEGKVEVVVEVEGAEVISDKSLDRILGKIGNEVVKLNPRKCILIYYSELKPIIQKKIRLYSLSLKVDFQFYGIKWILEQLNKYPDIADNYNIDISAKVESNKIADTEKQTKENVASDDIEIPTWGKDIDKKTPEEKELLRKKLEKILNINKENFTKKYKNIIESEEFYFQKARDVLERLKEYGKKPQRVVSNAKEELISGEEVRYKLYKELNEQWKKRGDKKTNAFLIFLKDNHPKLAPLYSLICQFISYVDKNAWNRQILNEYEDKRCIAKTGISQTYLISQFLEFALNSFNLDSELPPRTMYRVIDYLYSPNLNFNITSNRHRSSISNYFLGEDYTYESFDTRLIEFFEKYGYLVLNPENLTLLYTVIIYDESIRNDWDINSRKPKKKVSEDNPPIDNNSDDDLNDESDNTKDKIPFHLDQVVDIDKLGREPIAKAFVDLIKNDVFTDDLNHSFIVHLQGEWGTGKSSFLNLIKKNLNSGEENWIVVNYNAWQNQHIKPPWWTLIDHIYRKSKPELNCWHKCGLWIKENFRRVIWYHGWQKILAIALTLGFIISIIAFGSDIYKFLTDISFEQAKTESKDKIKALSDFAKLLLTLSTGVGVIFTFSKSLSSSFFMKTPEDAESFTSKASDPMNRIKKHFGKLVDNINSEKQKRQLAIFIDDIDRCNKEFIVKLLEGIQTLFKEKRVLYIVAGEKKWITTSFGNIYSEFCSENESKTQLGELFVEKAFQLSFRMPNVSNDAKKDFWNYILGETEKDIKESPYKELEESAKKLGEAVVEVSRYAAMDDITSVKFMKSIEESFNLSRDEVSSIIIDEKIKDKDEIKHLLKGFHEVIDSNPRSIIRLANNYSMSRYILIAERKDISVEKLFRWLVIEDLLPNIKLEIKNLKTVEEVIAFIDKEKLDDKLNNVLKELILDKEDARGGLLKIENIKNIMGL